MMSSSSQNPKWTFCSVMHSLDTNNIWSIKYNDYQIKARTLVAWKGVGRSELVESRPVCVVSFFIYFHILILIAWSYQIKRRLFIKWQNGVLFDYLEKKYDIISINNVNHKNNKTKQKITQQEVNNLLLLHVVPQLTTWGWVLISKNDKLLKKIVMWSSHVFNSDGILFRWQKMLYFLNLTII